MIDSATKKQIEKAVHNFIAAHTEELIGMTDEERENCIYGKYKEEFFLKVLIAMDGTEGVSKN